MQDKRESRLEIIFHHENDAHQKSNDNASHFIEHKSREYGDDKWNEQTFATRVDIDIA